MNTERASKPGFLGPRPWVPRWRPLTAGLLVAALGALATVHADPRMYVNVTGDSLLVCSENRFIGDPGFDEGGACFEAGHIQPDEAGTAWVSIVDFLISPVSGFYCQDFNDNALCGEGLLQTLASDDPNLPRLEHRSPATERIEPGVRFCGTVMLQAPLDPTPREDWSTNNWDPDSDVYILVDGPGSGNVAQNPCGTLYSGGIVGEIWHS